MSENTRTLIGYTTYLIGTVGCLLCGVLVSGLMTLKGWSVGFFWLTIIGLITCTVMVIFSSYFLVPPFDRISEIDNRPPVLFLRPFNEDKSRTYDVISAGESTVPIQGTSEDFLLALNAIGPFVSIGEPNWESRIGIFPQGAYRIFVRQQGWQKKVEELLSQSRLVVLTVGESAGIEWEIETVKNNVHHTSLLLYLPPRPTDALTKKGRAKKEKAFYEEFKAIIEKHFPIHLPNFQDAIYIIGFTEDGTPIFGQSTSKKKWWFTEFDRTSTGVSEQLKHVLSVILPDHDLSSYTIIGQPAMYARYIVATVLFFFGLGLGWIWQDSDFSVSGEFRMIFNVITTIIIQFTLVIGWVLIAKYFRQAWIWIIPVCIGTGSVFTIVFTLYQNRILVDLNFIYSVLNMTGAINTLTSVVSSLLILMLGIWLNGRKPSPSE